VVFMITKGRFLIIGICTAASMLSVNAQETNGLETKAVISKKYGIKETQFANLVRIVNIHGICEVSNPDKSGFEQMKYGKAYPMGTTFRTGADGNCIMIFSTEDSAVMETDTEVVVTACMENVQLQRVKSLTVKLARGRFKTTLRDNLADGKFTINTPNAEITNMSGRGEYILTTEGGNDLFKGHSVTGKARIEGPNYTIPALQAANKVNILTTPDRTFTSLTSISGDFAIELPDGEAEPVTFSMSPKAIVKLWREIAPIGGRTIVSALIVSPKGIARHRFVYAQGRESLTTGELVQSDEEPVTEELPLLIPTMNNESSADSSSDF